MRVHKPRKQFILSKPFRQKIASSSFDALSDFFSLPEFTSKTISTSFIEEFQPVQVKEKSSTKVPICKKLRNQSFDLTEQNPRRKLSNPSFKAKSSVNSPKKIKKKPEETTKRGPQDTTKMKMKPGHKSKKKSAEKAYHSKPGVKINIIQDLIRLEQPHHKNSQTPLEMYRGIMSLKDKTRKHIECEEKQKQNLFQSQKEKVKKLITDGVISPQNCNSFAFTYEGSLIPVVAPAINEKNRWIQLKPKQCSDVNISSIYHQKPQDFTNSKVKQQKTKVPAMNKDDFKSSSFIKNFNNLPPGRQVSKSGKKLSIQLAKNIIYKIALGTSRESNNIQPLSYLDENEDKILGNRGPKNYQEVLLKKSNYGKKPALKKRFIHRKPFITPLLENKTFYEPSLWQSG